MRLEHHLVGGYVRYISPYIIIIIKASKTLAVHEIVCACVYFIKYYTSSMCLNQGVGGGGGVIHALFYVVPHPPTHFLEPDNKKLLNEFLGNTLNYI